MNHENGARGAIGSYAYIYDTVHDVPRGVEVPSSTFCSFNFSLVKRNYGTFILGGRNVNIEE